MKAGTKGEGNAGQQLFASKRDLSGVCYDTLLPGSRPKAAAGALADCAGGKRVAGALKLAWPSNPGASPGFTEARLPPVRRFFPRPAWQHKAAQTVSGQNIRLEQQPR